MVYQNDTYCAGGENLYNVNSPWMSDVFYAQFTSSGTLGGWTETTDYGATSGDTGAGGIAVSWPSCVEYNGYIYCIGGATSSSEISKVFFAQLSSSGVGPWTETTDFGASSGTTGSGGIQAFQLSCVADSGYVYCVGAGSKVFYAQLSSSGVGPWIETTDYGAASGDTGAGGINISATACTDDNGTIYCVGGSVSFKPVSDVFYAQLSSSGVGPWTETTDYGATSGSSGSGGVPIYGTACIAALSNVICVDGDTTGNQGTNGVYYAKDPPIPVILRWILDSLPDPEDIYDEAFIAWVHPYISCGNAIIQYYGLTVGGGTNVVESAPLTTQATTVCTTSTTTEETTTTTETIIATPNLTTSISEVVGGHALSGTSSAALGYPVFDTATLSGGNNPTGPISYYWYNTGDCSGAVTTEGTPTGATGNGPQVNSSQVTPTMAGSYSFRAEFGGDPRNEPAMSACEKLTVLKNTPTIFTVLNPSSTIPAGKQAYDSAGLSLGYSPTGNVTYYRYSGPNCTGTKNVLGGGMVGGVGAPSPTAAPNSPYTTFPNPGTYSYSASYSGDANNNPADSACETLTVVSASASTPDLYGSSSSSSGTVPFNVMFNSYLWNVALTGPTQESIGLDIYNGSSCTGTPFDSLMLNTTRSQGTTNVTFPPGGYTFQTPGTYSWQLGFGGDTSDNPISSVCYPLTALGASSSGGVSTTTLVEIGAIAAVVVAGSGIYVLTRGRGKEEPSLPTVTVNRSDSVLFGTDKAVWGRSGSASGVHVPVTNMWSTPIRLNIRGTLKSGTSTYVLVGMETLAPGQTGTVFLQDFLNPVPSGTYEATFEALDENNQPVSAPTTPITITAA